MNLCLSLLLMFEFTSYLIVQNLLQILSTDVSAARRIARKVSARGGGLPMAETLRVVCVDSTEIACMLLKSNWIGADRVQNLEAQEGLDVEKEYSGFGYDKASCGSVVVKALGAVGGAMAIMKVMPPKYSNMAQNIHHETKLNNGTKRENFGDTNSNHSLAKRVKREKISERMKQVEVFPQNFPTIGMQLDLHHPSRFASACSAEALYDNNLDVDLL
ncbi:unnamed protein product [Vicia faba]|uniref:Uncharacterized protein n=1 Tax=Vicia faba TaxID=3906 RepID=A0AAV0ZAJ6_VICFA|nr:unnamed protein product [Vicia faba]